MSYNPLDNVVSPELVAEIDSAQPEVILPDSVASVALEGADFILHSLGLTEIHDKLWGGRHVLNLTIDAQRDLAEQMFVEIKRYLRAGAIPKLAVWFPSQLANTFLHLEVTA